MIYLIGPGSSGPIKIGRALDPKRRLRELQTGSPTPLTLFATGEMIEESGAKYRHDWVVEDIVAEGILHRHFRKQRLKGEWFDITLNEAVFGTMDGCCFDHLRPSSVIGFVRLSWEGAWEDYVDWSGPDDE